MAEPLHRGLPDYLLGNILPESFPVSPKTDTIEQRRPSPSVATREIEAAHGILDEMGVPQTIDLGAHQTAGGITATHILRLHGRLRLLKEELSRKGVTGIFSRDD